MIRLENDGVVAYALSLTEIVRQFCLLDEVPHPHTIREVEGEGAVTVTAGDFVTFKVSLADLEKRPDWRNLGIERYRKAKGWGTGPTFKGSVWMTPEDDGPQTLSIRLQVGDGEVEFRNFPHDGHYVMEALGLHYSNAHGDSREEALQLCKSKVEQHAADLEKWARHARDIADALAKVRVPG